MTDEALAGAAAQVDGVVVGVRVQHRAEAAAAAAGDQEGRGRQRGADEVVGKGVVGRARVAEFAEVVVVDGDVVVDVVALAAVDLDRGAVAAVVVGEGVRAGDPVVGHLGLIAVQEHAEGARVVVGRRGGQHRHLVVVDDLVVEHLRPHGAGLDIDPGDVVAEQAPLDPVIRARDLHPGAFAFADALVAARRQQGRGP